MDDFRAGRRGKGEERRVERFVPLDICESELHGAVIRVKDDQPANVKAG